MYSILPPITCPPAPWTFPDSRPDVSSKIKRAGPFLLGPNVGNSPPVKCLQQYLARRETTRDFYTLKILTLPERDEKEPESIHEQQGKILLHTEHTLLSRLKGQKGIIQHRGFFKEIKDEEIEVSGKLMSTGSKVTRLCLVLDATATPHDYGDGASNSHFTNLQYYVLKNKKLPEVEAISIFVNIVQIVQRLHEENIVHRDLKLGNFTLNIETKEVLLGNFGLGKELETSDQLLTDQRGSPAYISPEVIFGKPYLGKPSDMWALGVALYTMLYGHFPFYEQDPQELFRKIKAAEYKIPGDVVIGSTSVNLIKSLLVLNPNKRLIATELLQKLRGYVNLRYSIPTPSEEPQVVPETSRKRSRRHVSKTSPPGAPRSGDEDEPSQKRTKVQIQIQNMFDLEEVLIATASQLEKVDQNEVEDDDVDDEGEVGLQEIPQQTRSQFVLEPTSGLSSIKFTKVKDDARVLTQGDLEKLYAIYVASRTKANVGGASPAAASQAVVQQAEGVDSNVGNDSSRDGLDTRVEDSTATIGGIDSVTLPNVSAAAANAAMKRLRRQRDFQATAS